MKSARASAALIVLLAVALVGGGSWAAIKGGWFSGQSKRAKTSTATTTALVNAQDASGSAAAAYVTTMASVAATLPESKETAFIGKAGAIALSYLPAPDPQKLLEAERLKVAYLAGQLELANTLTANALQDSGRAKQELARAISAKRASDLALEEAAAEARGAESQKFLFLCIALAAGALYIWTKLSHVSPLTLSAAIQDMRTGLTEPNTAIAAINSATTPFQQMNVRAMYWLRDKLSKVV